MNSILHHPAPHVVSGTNFNIHRFNELYRWIAAMSADSASAAMQPNGYGLLLPPDDRTALDLQLNGNSLVLARCSAVTPSGHLVGIFEEKWGRHTSLTAVLDPTIVKQRMDVAVVVNPMERQPVGEASLEEVPARQPFSLPAYRLELSPCGQKDYGKLPFCFKIGEVEQEDGKFMLRDYVPACVHLGAHPLLWKKYLTYEAELGRLQASMAVFARQNISQNLNIQGLKELSICLGRHLAERQAGVWALGMKGSPEALFSVCAGFAGLFKFCLESMHNEPEVMELIRHNIDSTVGLRFQPQALRDAVRGMAEHRYSNLHLLQSVYQADVFFSVVSPVFQVMQQRVAPASPVQNRVAVW